MPRVKATPPPAASNAPAASADHASTRWPDAGAAPPPVRGRGASVVAAGVSAAGARGGAAACFCSARSARNDWSARNRPAASAPGALRYAVYFSIAARVSPSSS